MTDLSHIGSHVIGSHVIGSRVGAARDSRRIPRSVLLEAGVIGVGAAAFVVGRQAGGDASAMEWQLVFLLRFMAVVKGLMVLGALALTHWRLLRPASDALTLGYGAALALMAAAPGLIWSLGPIGSGALLFHAGLLLFLGLAWRDGAVRLPPRRT